MYIALYKNGSNDPYTPPDITPSEANYEETAYGSRESLWMVKREVTGSIIVWNTFIPATPVQPSRAALVSDVGQEIVAADGSIWTGQANTLYETKWLASGTTTDSNLQVASPNGTCYVIDDIARSSIDDGVGNYARYVCSSTSSTTYSWSLVRTRKVCTTCPPTGGYIIDDECECGSTYYRSASENVYNYYWEMIQEGIQDIIYGGLIKDVKEDITKRVYDLDTSRFEGLSDELLEEPLVFVLKEEDGTTIYSGYVNSWSQDGKTVKFKGVDFKKIFDTEIKLDFYADMISVNLQITTILNMVFNNFGDNHPAISFTIPTITTDTAYISNLLGQVFITNALKFLKVYLVTFGLFITPVFNELSKEIEITIGSNNQSSEIRLDDFVFESSRTDTKINKCIATIADKQEEEYTDEIVWLRSNASYYDSQPESNKMIGAGKNDNYSSSIFFNPTSTHNIGTKSFGLKSYSVLNIYLSTTARTLLSSNNKVIIFVPYHKYFDFKRSFISFDYVSTGQFYTAGFDVNSARSQYIDIIHMGDKAPFNELGQGWMIIDVTKLYAEFGYPSYASMGIVIKEGVATADVSGIANTYKNAFRIATLTLQFDVDNYLFDTPINEHPWYMRPTDIPEYEGDIPPFGFAYQSYDGSNYYYWQIGQVPRTPKNLPKKSYYLGKDNEIYEENIETPNQIYPVQTKIFAEEFFYKAQFNAIYELVNSRFNENIIIIDNIKINPLELSFLGLNANVTVHDKNNSTAILPVSEIEIKNGIKRVKLGFKKTLFTEVIKT